MNDKLELILKRILPLRHNGGHNDFLVFLGDYIDRKIDSHKVLDTVINVKQNFPDRVITLLGNHELMLLQNLRDGAHLGIYNLWMKNGGEETLMGYLQRSNSEIENPYLIMRKDINRFIPKNHLDFLNSLLSFYETDEYIFVHGGCEPFRPLDKQDPEVLVWDRSIYYSMSVLYANKSKCQWKKTIVTGHNSEIDGEPFIWDKFMMLDGSKAERLYVWELNSRTGFSARKNNKRLVKERL